MLKIIIYYVYSFNKKCLYTYAKTRELLNSINNLYVSAIKIIKILGIVRKNFIL